MSILWANACPKPSWLKRQKRTGVQALGLAYERKAAKALSGTLHGQWFTYGPGKSGKHWCQPDLIFQTRDETLVIECKLTDVEAAKAQLEALYLPVVRLAFERPAIGFVLAKHLSKVTNPELVVTDLARAINLARAGLTPILHWPGTAPLVPQTAKSKAEVLALPAARVP